MNVNHVSKSIHNTKILEDVNFNVDKGRIIGVIGRNGAGKTTLLRTMAGILLPTTGTIEVNAKNIKDHPKLKENIFYVPDSSNAIKKYSTKEIVKLYSMIYRKFDIDYFNALMTRFQLNETKKISSYSKGMKALFSLILAFSTKAQIILLDEPTDGLDLFVKKQILQLIVEEVSDGEKSIVIASHRLEELEFMVNDVVMIKKGKVDRYYQLDEMKNLYSKAQLAYSGELPDSIRSKIKIVQQTGRVYTILYKNNESDILTLLNDSSPLIFENLPLTLEDLFLAELGGDNHVS